MKAISDFAKSQDIRMHLDGARIWHVASTTGTTMKDLCDPFDSVSICISKGLGNIAALLHFPRLKKILLRRCPRGIYSSRE